MKNYIQLTFLIFSYLSFAQVNTTDDLQLKRNLQENSILKNVPFKNIGPTIMSGRVVDIDVNPENTNEFYAAYASGGLWYTNNNGTSFEPILDSSDTQNIGDIAVDWLSETIWVGTGENNSSRSSYAGIGILKSTDKGKTWTNVGLKDSHHIGKIQINPKNPNEVVVGVIGHLYTDNIERGVFKTTDGGKTWTKTLFINESTGIIDLEVSPTNFNIQFAAAWQRERKSWNFNGNGINSGIYKSIDAGKTWNKINTNSGFPNNEGVGRIGLAVYDDNTIYALLDNQNRKPKERSNNTSSGELSKEDFKNMSIDEFLNLKDKPLNKFLKRNGFQEKYRAENVKQLVRAKEITPKDLAKYLEDANSLLFDTPVIGAEIYKSTDSGKTWTKTHDDYLDDLVYSYGYYFGLIRVNENNSNDVYVAGVPVLKSKDGGKTFTSINKENVHVDHHALWINKNNENHLILGNDGGINISYDDGENWIKNNSPSVGQFYAIQVDNEKPYNVFGGLQDNGVWYGSNEHKENKAWHQKGKYSYQNILGGDGMQIMIDDRDSNIIYTGYQFGNYYRINKKTNQRKYIQPKHQLGENPYRFNWQTPILLSKHNQDILYLGGNKLMRSLDKGNNWQAISADLTKGGKKGNVAFGTITAISESPFKFGLIYVGSDDGLIQLTKDGGNSWSNLSVNLPENLWASRIVASSHIKNRVYVTLNGYRNDDFKSYIYMSDDFGETWKDISSNIPNSPVNVIREDFKNKNILYVGTDNGLYASLNNGNSWEAFSENLPNVAVHDLAIQQRENDLVVGTHGRSIYKTNLNSIQKLTEIKDIELHVFKIDEIEHNKNWGNSWSKWLEPNSPEKDIIVYSLKKSSAKMFVKNENNDILYAKDYSLSKGLNYLTYDLSISEKGKNSLLKLNNELVIDKKTNEKYYLPKGNYIIEIATKEKTVKENLIID